MAAAIKAYKGMGMEGGIARWYDRTTRKGMPEIRSLASRISEMLAPGAEVLEIAPGPGFLSIELAKRGLAVRAVDISKTFVELAKKNAADEGVTVCFELGNAAALPVESASVDFVVCRAAFKNFSEPVKALAEMKRILRPGGRALLIDMRRDIRPAEIRRYVDGLDVGLLNRWFITLSFRTFLVHRAYRLDDIQTMATKAGWSNALIETAPLGFDAWMTA